jgi:ATP-dependent Clp protease ATP-binding subunit ClpC
MDFGFYFDLKKTNIYLAIKLEPIFGLIKIFKKIFQILFLILFFIWIFNKNEKILGFFLVSFSLFITCLVKDSFFETKLKKTKPKIEIKKALENPEIYNFAEFFSFETLKAILKSKENSNSLFYHLLIFAPNLDFIFLRALLAKNEILKTLKENLKGETTEFKEIILDSLEIAKEKGKEVVEAGDLLVALAKYNSIFKQILMNANLKLEDIENLVSWLEEIETKINQQKKFWDWKNLIKSGSLAKEWAAGYTVLLDQFSIDITKLMRWQKFKEIYAHQQEVQTMERILARPEKNNVLIVGESGSARKSMIEALANRSALGESLPELNYKRVVFLDMPKLLAFSESVEEVEKILDQILKEVILAGNVILAIDNLHNYVGVEKEKEAGTLDITGILLSYLTLPSFQFVGITTYEGLHRNIEKKPEFLQLLEKIEVSEISEKETMLILRERTLKLEKKYKIITCWQALREIISLTAKYMANLPFPEKAMDLLDEAMVYCSQRKIKVILPEHIAKIVTEKTQIPVGEIETKEREILLNLEKFIHQRIINQEEAVKEICAAMRRARAGIAIRKGPIGSFLFLGPTGVGKTETSKALAEIYFGSENKMIRIDMSEFQTLADIPRLIGSSGEKGLLTTAVRETPFSLVLLDEFEKAHSDILNLFLQVLDEGWITDGLGRKVDFKNTIIIATSNAGYQVILDALREKIDWQKVKEKILNFCFEKGIFRPELINRFDAVVVFKPLTKENLLAISELLLKKLQKNLKEKEIEFVITQPLKEKIVELGYDPTFGARNIQRVIQDKVGNLLAQALLNSQLKKGDRVEVDPQKFELIINP